MSSPTASPCYVVLLELESDGYGTLKTLSGLKYTACTNEDGFTWTHARSFGILLVYTLKVSYLLQPSHNLLLICLGWNRKIAYCIAFSNDGATDVTRRYVRNPAAHGLPRTRCPEECLLWMMYEIRKIRRGNMSKPEQQKLRAEDEREERELQSYVAHSLTRDMLSAMPGSRLQPGFGHPPPRPDEQKAPVQTPQEEQWEANQFVPHTQHPRRDGR